MGKVKSYTNPELAHKLRNEMNDKMARARKGFGGEYRPGTQIRLNGNTVYTVGQHGEWLRYKSKS